MNVVLRPYGEFTPQDLGEQFSYLVPRNEPYLLERNIRGPLERYGNDVDGAIANVAKGQAEHAQLGHFAVVNADEPEKAIGAASIYPGLLLKKRGLITVDLPYAAPNIHAWTDMQYDRQGLDKLQAVYGQLRQMALLPDWQRDNSLAWTLEPSSADAAYHEAISASGLAEIASGPYDDGESVYYDPESQQDIVIPSTLYAAFYGRCVSHSTRRKERRLRRGAKALRS